MQILLAVNNDFFSHFALNLLLRHISIPCNYQLILSPRVGNPTYLSPELVAFEREHMAFASFENLAKGYGMPCRMVENIHAPEVVASLRDFSLDVIISIRFGQIFRGPLLQLPNYAILNLHSGLLPQYRGIMASFWALKAQESNLGATLHYVVDKGIDTGPIIATFPFARNEHLSFVGHLIKLYQIAMPEVAHVINAWPHKGAPKATPQSGTSRYFSYPTQADYDAFAKLGGRLITEEDTRHLRSLL